MASRSNFQPELTYDPAILLASKIIQAQYWRPKTGKS